MESKNSFYNNLIPKLTNPIFFKEFLFGLVDAEDQNLEHPEALRDTIRIMGASKFSKLVDMPENEIQNFIDGEDIDRESLDRFLKPFNLRTKIVFEDVV